MVVLPSVGLFTLGLARLAPASISAAVFLLGTPLLLLALWGASSAMVQRGWRRELGWRSALPFPVEGLEATLGTRTHELERQQVVSLYFAGPAPEAKQLGELLSADGGAWTVRSSHGHAECTRHPGLGVRDQERNRRLLVWLHSFVRGQLLPLHARFPLASVRLFDHRR